MKRRRQSSSCHRCSRATQSIMTSANMMAVMAALTIMSSGVTSLSLGIVSKTKVHRGRINDVFPSARVASNYYDKLHHSQILSSWPLQASAATSASAASSSRCHTQITTRLDTTKLHASKSSTAEKEAPVDLTSLRKLVAQAIEIHDKNLASSTSYDQVRSRLSDLETESSDPEFWDAANSQRNEAVTRDISRYSKLKEEMELWGSLREDAKGALELLEELLGEINNSKRSDDSDDDDDECDEEMISLTMDECQSCASQLLELSQKYELTTLLSGPYDASNCRLVLTAGAGGTEACDWVSMLYRMYSRHASHMDMKITTLDESSGDVVGYKSVELLVEGTNAYGWFKGEKGAHRLVRLSPFNANNKRQTTFAGVDVVPVLEEEELTEIDIPDKELEVTTMRSGGKGGQNVNKVETGVRIKHVPSGISVKCTQERSQGMNKSIALSRLKAQLLAIAQEQQLQDFKAIRGDVVEASWGAQIRNYVMQPYKMVKDARGSSHETSDVDGVLDGGSVLEEFVGAWLRYVRTKEEKEREEMELEV